MLVCRKCTRKAHGGFGAGKRKPLAKVLRKELGITKGRHAEIGFIEVGCFDICPRKRVTVALGSAPGACQVIPCGMPAPDIVRALDLARHVDKPATESKEPHQLGAPPTRRSLH